MDELFEFVDTWSTTVSELVIAVHIKVAMVSVQDRFIIMFAKQGQTDEDVDVKCYSDNIRIVFIKKSYSLRSFSLHQFYLFAMVV